MRRKPLFSIGLWLLLWLLATGSTLVQADTKTIARCGPGFLEEVDGYKVLHLKGASYEMGLQQGALLKGDIREVVHFLFEVKAKELKVEVAVLNLLNPKRANSNGKFLFFKG